MEQTDCGDALASLRRKIDRTDDKLAELFVQRMELCARIASVKADFSAPVRDEAREHDVLMRAKLHCPAALSPYAARFFTLLMDMSREYQQDLLDTANEPHKGN